MKLYFMKIVKKYFVSFVPFSWISSISMG